MLELNLLEASVVACYAAAAVLDAWSPSVDAYVARIARDEVWVIGSRTGRCGLMRGVEESLRAVAPDTLVVDQTDGWTAWSVGGDGAADAMARLTVMPLEPRGGTFQQGAVAGVPAKVIACSTGYQVFVPAPVGHHLRDRVLEACADLAPSLGPAGQFEGRVG